ncbi:hypothetical protein [Vibrio splendidus]|uniref:hypothetical protein n=1 Tax=Vibrio splendidus TaxID=29497 RepID=UPI003D12E1A3
MVSYLNQYWITTRGKVEAFTLSFFITILGLAVPIVTLQVYDRLLKNQSVETAFVLVGGAAIAIMLESFLRYGRSYLLSRYSVGFETSAEKHFMRRFLTLNHSGAAKIGAAEIIENQGDLAILKNHYMGQTIIALFDLPFTLFYLLVIFYIGGIVVLVPIGIILVLLALAFWLRSLAAELIVKKEHDHLKTLTHLYNIFSHAKKLKLNVKGHLESTITLADEAQESRLTLGSLNLFSGAIVMTLSQLTTVLVVLVGAILVIHGDMTTGALAALTILGGRCISPVSRLISHNIGLESIAIATERMTALEAIDTPRQFALHHETRLPANALITLADAVIQHKGTALSFNLTIKPGEKFCLVDDSPQSHEMAKAFMKILSVDVSITSGCFELGGAQASDYARDIYYQHVAYVPNNVTLFPGSLLQNLSNFQEGKEDKVFELCETFGLHAFFEDLPAGYKTNINIVEYPPFNRGTVQLIGLIRALVYQPLVLLLDEIDAGLDEKEQGNMVNYFATQSQLTVIAIPFTQGLKQSMPLLSRSEYVRELTSD